MQKRQIFVTDIIIEAAIPLLIIGLIWSTVIFAITINDIAYHGGGDMLKLVFFLYVMGTVMINRIAGYYRESGKAVAYSIVLVCLMAIFALQFSGRQGSFFGGQGEGTGILLNLALIVVVGIVSYKIARESCLDLQDTGKEKTALQLKNSLLAQRDWYQRMELEEEQERERLEEEKKEAEEKPDPERERIPKKHPGIWIVYFSLFSLVVFAVGQRLLPKDDGDLYRYTFTCLAANLTCALALLSLITLSSVRQRSWEKRTLVRPGVGWFWIMGGTAIIVVVVSLATLPPRPVPSYLGRKIAQDEISGSSEEEEEQKQDPRSPRTWAGMTRQIEADLEKEERDKARFIEEQRKKMEGEDGEEGQQEPDEDGEDGEKSGWFSSSSGGSSGSGKGKGQSEKQGSSENETQKKGGSSSARRTPPLRLPPTPTPALAGLQTLGKFILMIICAIALIYALIMALKALGRSNPLQKLSGALKRFRENLKKMFAVAKMPRLSRRELGALLVQQNLYMENPFRNKALLKRMSPKELVSYTYKAFENFSHVNGYTPDESQTAVEFVQSLPEEFCETEFSVLVKLFMIAEYSDRPISDKNIKYLQQTWKKIEA